MNLNLPIPSHTLTTLGLFLIKSKRSQSFLALCKTAAFTLWLLLSNLFIQAQDGDYTYEGETLDPVVAEARLKIMFKELTDIDRLIHSVSIGKIAKDTRLVEYAEGFMERNQIEVLTIGYIDSDALWPRVFKNQRLKKIEKADTDDLLVGKIIFVPVEDGEDITGYTVELQLTGKAVSVYELLDVSKEQLDLIAEETTEEELGSTEYAKPKLAQDAVVNAMILALQRVDEQSSTEPGGNTTQHVAFAAASNQHFGFDGSFKEEFKTDYPSIRVGGKSYRSAWKSLKSNTPDQVIATDPANQDLTFEFNGTPVTATSGADDTYSLTLTGQSDEVEGELLVKVGDYLTGQLNTISYDNVEQVVKIVPINGAGGGITQGQLQTKLNEIYGVAIASWNVEVLANQNLGTAWDDEGNGLEVGDNSTLSNYTSEMNDLIRAFKQNNDRDKKAYYVFLVNKAESSTYLGYMPRKKQWGFVFTEGQSTDQLITTIAHELGHGVYRLEHTFSEKGIPKGQTQNLMDYAGGTDLYKYQWDYVHDPESVVTLFDDEEDAAYEEEMMSFYEEAAPLLTEPGSEDFFDRLKQLDKITSFFNKCNATGWASYEDKGVMPECFWKDAVISSSLHHTVADLPFMAGIVDGAYGEIDGTLQLVKLVKNAPNELGKLSYLIAYHYYKCSPADIELSIARYTYLIEQIEVENQHKDIWSKATIWWNNHKAEAKEIEAQWEQCEESGKLISQINDLHDFITDLEAIIDTYLVIEGEIKTYLNTLEEGDNEGRYLRGKLVVPVATTFVGVGTFTKIAKAKEAIKQLKNFNKWDDFTIALGQRLGRVGKKLTFRPTWMPERAIAGNLDNPKGLIGVYNKNLPDGSLVDDTQRALADLDFPETYASNFTTASKDGYKMLNTNEWYYRMDEPAFWDDFNKPWLDKLTSDKADIVVLSDRSSNYLKYQWQLENGKAKYILDDDLQKIKTGFGKEIEYMEDLVNRGLYEWDAGAGVYRAAN